MKGRHKCIPHTRALSSAASRNEKLPATGARKKPVYCICGPVASLRVIWILIPDSKRVFSIWSTSGRRKGFSSAFKHSQVCMYTCIAYVHRAYTHTHTCQIHTCTHAHTHTHTHKNTYTHTHTHTRTHTHNLTRSHAHTHTVTYK